MLFLISMLGIFFMKNYILYHFSCCEALGALFNAKEILSKQSLMHSTIIDGIVFNRVLLALS